MAYDLSQLIPSISPLASAGVDPDEALASGDPYGMLAARKAGVPYTPRTVSPMQAAMAKYGGTVTPPPPAIAQATGKVPPADNALNPASETTTTPAIPSTVTPSGKAQTPWSETARRAIAGQMSALDRASQAAQASPAPDINKLEQARTSAVAGAPNPNDPQYRPSAGRRIARGVLGALAGLGEGGIRGALVGGIMPQATTGTGYSAPSGQFSARARANAEQVANLDQQIATAQKEAQTGNPAVKDATGIASGYGNVARTVGDLESAERGPKPNAGNTPLEASTIPALNDAIAARWTQLHPDGKEPLPKAYVLQPGSTQNDFNEIDRALAVEKPPTAATGHAVTLQLPGGKRIAGKTDRAGNLLLEDGTPAPKGTLLYQQPSYGQLVLPTRTQQVLVDGIPTIMRWNPATQNYDIPVGQSATGAYGHEEAQAGAVARAGEDLISDIRANKDALGTVASWVGKYGLNTPIADPKLAQLKAELETFAALQPAMHGFRAHSAMETFDKIVGDLQKNPDATIASIQGILKTASAINPAATSTKPGNSSLPPASVVKSMKEGQYVHGPGGVVYQKKGGKLIDTKTGKVVE